MNERLSLRVRFFLFFALIAVAVPFLLGGGLWLAAQRLEGNPTPHLLLFGGAAGFALIGVVVGVWQLFDQNVARPIQTIVRDLQTLLHANPQHEVDTTSGRYLGLLAPVVREIADAFANARADVDKEVTQATHSLNEQRQQLEAILRELNEGVIVCNSSHRILLYNRRALQILGVTEGMGLGRPLFSILNEQPFVLTLDRLTSRYLEGRHETHPDRLMTGLVFARNDGSLILEGRMSLIVDDADHEITGYVLTFDDVTSELKELIKSDRLMRSTLEELRHPVASLRAAVEMLDDMPADDADARRAFQKVLAEESQRLSSELERFGEEYRAIVTSQWPMSDVHSGNLLNALTRQFRNDDSILCDVTGEPIWLRCDSTTVVALLSHIIRRALIELDAQTFLVSARTGTSRSYIEVTWEGDVASPSMMERWLKEPIERGLGLTGVEILEHHKSEAWCEPAGGGKARVRIPVPPPASQHTATTSTAPLPIRLEFYDFNLLKPAQLGAVADTSLRDLTYVVFDTETTGLEPSNGDEIIQIAGVRILNGRILTGEAFDQLVDPGRRVPPLATRITGISQEMVAGKPRIDDVLPRFHDYVGESVLVAHNAAFDMKFLQLKQERCNLRFDNPVLDTVLLSAIVHDHTNQHTLDAVAERFSIEIPPETRHTALGDSLATAGVLLKLIELLEVHGIRTLGEAIEASNKIVEIRRRQAKY
ncbi:MAG: PAS domain-containing protein [Hyphomicrobiaceae bacterium]|nr:PAS domain-containing protein [Hyphomicrobiaceae bacterium]MCC0007336.1 PAS domain-containing protein [Hyphomicrobiaceae bacterium]